MTAIRVLGRAPRAKTGFFVQRGTRNMITGCSDLPGLTASVKISGGVAAGGNGLVLAANNFLNPVVNDSRGGMSEMDP